MSKAATFTYESISAHEFLKDGRGLSMGILQSTTYMERGSKAN